MIKLLALMSCFIPVALNAIVSWEKVVSGILDGDTLPGLYTGGFERNKMVLCDIDADDDLDMLIGMWGGTVMFYENVGDATHPEYKFITENFGDINVRGGMKKGYAAPEFADIDGDGDYDCWCGDYEGKVHWYENIGDSVTPAFALRDTHFFGVLYRHSNLAFCDINADGDFDIFVGGEDGQNAYYENTGTADSFHFELRENYWCAGPTYSQIDPTFCDIDGDGDYDFFTGEVDGHLVYWRNEGTPSKDSMVHITDAYQSFCVHNRSGGFFADIDGDEDFDLFFGAKDGLFRFYENTGTSDSAKFEFVTEQFLYVDFVGHSSPTFCDIDADGDMDMFVGVQEGRIRMLENVGDAGHPKWVYETPEFDSITTNEYAAPVFVDINNDGSKDLFIGNGDGTLVFYLNTGTPSDPVWQFVTNNFENIDAGNNSKPAFGDMDGDGDFDLLIGTYTGKIWYYENTGGPTVPGFTLVDSNYCDSVPGWCALAVGDVDLDGDLDMIIGMSDKNAREYGYLRYYRNDGDSSSPVWVLADTAMYEAMNVGRISTPTLVDIDGDGDLDLFVGEGDGGINFWKNELVGVEEDYGLQITDYRLQIFNLQFLICNLQLMLICGTGRI